MLQPGENAVSTVQHAASRIEAPIIRFGPSRRASPAVPTIDSARPSVASETDSEALAGDTANRATNRPSSGCAQYSSAKVANPARNIASRNRRNRGESRPMRAGVGLEVIGPLRVVYRARPKDTA